jgi:dolichol-phosphate mannosyltransferase
MLSFVIPAHNEEPIITRTIAEIKAAIAETEFASDYEIIVVDDHSSDKTFDAVQQLGDFRTRAFRLSKRSGSHVALRMGLGQALGDAVVCLSADGQDDPAAVPSMIAAWRAGANTVWALRRNRADEPWRTKLLAVMFYKLLGFMGAHEGQDIDLSRADFYLLDRRVVAAVNACEERNTSLFGLIAWLGFVQDSVEYDRRERTVGRSKWNFTSRLGLAKDWIISFSGLPLKCITVLGFCLSFLGLLYAILIVLNYFILAQPVQGWSSIVMLILVLGGVQLVMLGVIGEYVWRNFSEAKKRPLYFLERSTDEARGRD